MSIINDYLSGFIRGWAEELSKDQFAALLDQGFFQTPAKIVGATRSRPEYFSQHRVARKVLGKDIGGGVQGIGDCVSWGGKHAGEYTGCSDLLMRKETEKFQWIFAPYYYGTSRVYIGGGRLGNSDGSLGSWLAAAVERFGTLFENIAGVPKYSGSIAKRWGDPKPADDLDKWVNTAKPFLIRKAVKINNWDELCDAIANGYGCTVASDQGFKMTPNRNGYHDASGTWMHQMCIFGYGPDYALIANSWGDVHGQLTDFHEADQLPIGTIRARKSVVERMIAQGETFAFTQFDQLQEQRLDRALFNPLGY